MYRRKECAPPQKETFTVYSPVYVYIYIFIFIINPLLISWFAITSGLFMKTVAALPMEAFGW